jgi:myo-inositol 2-dehydrogenase/D-chiro-inositol 1-dehydrogenase
MESSSAGRRAFVSAAAGLLIAKPETVFGSQANSALEIGIVGCGGRGNWIGKLFREHAGVRIVALADVIRRNLEQTRQAFGVEPARAYRGPKAGQELAAGKLDAVVIETPVYYHPEHAAAAVNAGRHVFLAKPVAVDVPGCNTILDAGRKARGKLSFFVDFQTRARPVFREAASRIHRGDLGAPALAQIYYHAGRPAPDRSQPGMDAGQARLLNWLLDKTLSGDIIVEQNIHVIDLANWYLQSHPVKAYGTGGRTDWSGTRFNLGDAWDHFAVTYTYRNGVHADFSSNQLTNSYSSLTVRCFGRKGAADTNYGGSVRITGENAWMGAEKDDTFTGGAVTNIKDFVAGIQSGAFLNNAESAVESTLSCILGRTAAYENREVSWDEMLRKNERYEATLKLDW